MHAWAVGQGFADGVRARLITDDQGGGTVTVDDVYEAVDQVVQDGADQLIVYFAGHGVVSNRNEQWLLSDAPRRPYAAVNVSGSVELARYCGIPHVVFISDACRTAARGLQAQRVQGVEVFPNVGFTGRSAPVDQFFACLLGQAAAELPAPRRLADG